MPSVTKPIGLTITEAEPLADLVGVLYDLEAAEYRCTKAIELSTAHQPDSRHVEAMIESAVIKYGRCFKKAVRRGLRIGDISTLSSDEMESHRYFEALRDKFVAHSDNPFEETYITAAARIRDGKPCPIESLGHGQHRVVLCADTADRLRNLINKVKATIQSQITTKKSELLRVVQGMPLESIHGGDMHVASDIRDSDVFKSRTQSKGCGR